MLEKALLIGLIVIGLMAGFEMVENYHPMQLASEAFAQGVSECHSVWSADACQTR